MEPTMMDSATLLAEIEEFAQFAGVKPSTVTRKAVQNPWLPDRLRKNGTVTLPTYNRLRAYMESERRKWRENEDAKSVM